MTAKRVLITAANGNVGRAVVEAARVIGLDVTAATHAATSNASGASSTPSVTLDFCDPTTWPSALDGHDRVFLLRPPAIADVRPTLNAFVDEAARRGIEHIVFLSVAGAGSNRLLPHRKVENHLKGSGIGWTFLRPGFFAQNLETAYRADIVQDNRLYLPAERAPLNWIDVRDIGEVAARILAEPAGHRSAAYTMTGPGAVAWQEVAAVLSEVTGRPIRYEPASIPGYVAHLHGRGTPIGAIAVQTLLHVLLRFGQGSRYDPAVEQLLGRPACSIARYIHGHAEVWASPQQN